MNSQDTNKTSEQLQQEVHGQIDKIGGNIDTVRTRMSPGNLLDDAIFYPHGQSLQDTYGHLKNNPMGSMFLSLGTLLLMEDQDHVTYESHFKSSASDAWDKSRDTYHDARDSFSEKSAELSERVRLKAREAKERFSSKRDELAGEARSLERELESKGEGLLEKAKRLKDKGLEKINAARSTATGEAQDLRGEYRSAKSSARAGLETAKDKAMAGIQNARNRVRRATPIGEAMHPYAIASIGLGMGATFGASFPIKGMEKRLQDPQYQAKLQRLSADFDDAVRSAGERLKNHLIDELKQFNFH